MTCPAAMLHRCLTWLWSWLKTRDWTYSNEDPDGYDGHHPFCNWRNYE